MRVVVVSRWYPLESDPFSGLFVEDHVRALQGACEVQVVVPYDAPLREVLRFLRTRGPLATPQRVPVPRTPFGLPLRWLVLERAFARAVPAGDPDGVVVHVHLLLPDALAALTAAKRRRWPLAVTENAGFLLELLRSRRARAQLGLVLRHADAVLPVSDVLAAVLTAIEPGARLRKIGNPLDTDRYSPAADPTRAEALNVALRLGREKGTDVLLRAWAAAGAEAELPPLVLVGDDPEGMERLADELGLGGPCRFVGLRRRDELVPMLRNAAFLVSASRHENVAGVVTEALACGTPVVSTRTGEPANYVGESVGLLVEPGDVDGLARALATMARTHRGYDADELHGRMHRLYGYAVVREQLLELYGELLGRPGSRRVVPDAPLS